MNNTINNQSKGVEYSNLYRNLHKEVSEQNIKTARLPQDSLLNYIDRQKNDKVELKYDLFVNNDNDSEIEKLNKGSAAAVLNILVGAIKQGSGAAYDTQNKLLANRIMALLKS
ncbi:MAG: hypothetical protein LBH98_01445 [Chitinispirillales bacterium]|nr:hypothetical protein [Chitinispirillales bacterium]